MELLHFTAQWCNPCKRMEPVIQEFLSENPEISYQKIDVDLHPEIVSRYSVMGVPTFISVDTEEIKNRATGVIVKEKLENLFK